MNRRTGGEKSGEVRLPMSVYIVMIAALVANMIVTVIVIKYFM